MTRLRRLPGTLTDIAATVFAAVVLLLSVPFLWVLCLFRKVLRTDTAWRRLAQVCGVVGIVLGFMVRYFIFEAPSSGTWVAFAVVTVMAIVVSAFVYR